MEFLYMDKAKAESDASMGMSSFLFWLPIELFVTGDVFHKQ